MQPIRTLILDDDLDICHLISRAVAKRSYADVEVLQEASLALAAHEATPFELGVTGRPRAVTPCFSVIYGFLLCRKVATTSRHSTGRSMAIGVAE